MDVLKYRDLFISEAKENIQALNNLLVHIEKKPGDVNAIVEALRLMHSIKGSAGMMGLNEISEIAHEAENLLIEVRDGRRRATSDVIDTLFKCLDKINTLLEGITNKIDEKPINIESDLKDVNLKVFLETMEPLKPLRAFMLLRTLAECGDVVRTQPPSDALARGEYGNLVEAEVLTKDVHKLEESIKQIPDVVKVELAISNTTPKTDVSLLGSISLLERTSQIDELVSFVEESQAQSTVATITLSRAGEERKLEEVKVNIKNLDALFNLIGEIVLIKSRLNNIISKMDNDELKELISTLERLISDMQNEVMNMRLVPLRQIFNMFPRIIRDTAKELGKEVDFIITGGEIAVDKKILEEIVDPLIHLIRNAIDHGIEKSEERTAMGKPPIGTIKITAKKESSYIVIQVEDDGRGIDPGYVKRVAVEKGFISQEVASKLSDEEALMLICLPGFSTKGSTTLMSGRGMGMNTVKNKIEALGGHLSITSQVGKGTTVSLRLPTSMATMKTMLATVGSRIYAIPIPDIEAVLRVPKNAIKTVNGRKVILYRGEVVPILDMSMALNTGDILDQRSDNCSLVVIRRSSGQMIALLASSVIGEEEIVIKQLPRMLRGIKGLSGATILGDGSVSFIVDPFTLQ
ncbi:MAG: chemotaxis protein CheA [Candidatus Nezhaarchaeales archaeon]